MTKQVAVIGAAVMTTLLALVALWQFHFVVVYVLVSLALAATVRPLAKYWSGHGFAKRIIVSFLFLIGVVSFGFLVFLTAETAINELEVLFRVVSIQDKWNLPRWLQGSSFQQVLAARLPSPSQLFEAFTGEEGQLVLPAIIGFTQGIGNFVSGAVVILFLSIYWSINQIHFELLWLSLLSSDQRKQARGVWRTIEIEVGAYIRSELVQSLLAALLLGLGYWLIGSRYPTLLALIAALAWLVPVVGAPLAMIFPLLVGLMTSLQLGLLAALYTLIILFVLQMWVEPRFFKRKGDNPILTLVILLAMADALGLVGILVAPPLSVICQILWSRLVSHPSDTGDATQLSDLKERQSRIWETIGAMDEPPMPLVISSMERLANLIDKAEPILPTVSRVESADPFHPPVTAGGADSSKP